MKLSEKTFLFLSFILISNYVCVFGKNNILSERQVTEHFIKYFTKSQYPAEVEEFKKLIEIFAFPNYVSRSTFSEFSEGRLSLTCIACRSFFNSLKNLHDQGASEAELIEVLTDLCAILNIESERVCRGAAELNMNILLYIMDNEPNWNARSFCGVVVETNDITSCSIDDENYEFTLDIPPKNITNIPPTPGNSTFKIVQVSDIHYDPLYKPYGLAECNEPTCCRIDQVELTSRNWYPAYDDTSSIGSVTRDSEGNLFVDIDYAEEVRRLKRETQMKESTKEIPESKQAGYWGDYRHCDSPWWAFEDGVDRIVENHDDFDYIYYTGDTIDHGVWETSRELLTQSTSDIVNKFRSAFGNKTVFPVIGNHDSHPSSNFAPDIVTDPGLSSAWLYEMLVDKWSVWLPAEAADTIKKGGYYSVLVKPGFRVIVLNSNLWYPYNWWVHLQPKDPSGQFQWLLETLLQAEMNNERVHILAHIPPGKGDFVYTYNREYKRIIERFADIIAAEFHGHTHKDEFKVYYAKEDISKPIAVAWNGGSLTAYSNINPNYRVYEVDSNTNNVLDFETWVYNLTEANLTPENRPIWFKEYTFKETYGVDSLSLESMDELLNRMVTTDQHLLYNDFHIYRRKSAQHGACSDSCVRDYLGVIATTEFYDNRKSEELWDIYLNNKPNVPV